MKLFIRILNITLSTIALLVITLWFLGNQKIQAVNWQPAPNPGLVNEFAPNDLLSALVLHDVPSSHGPEDIAYDGSQYFYTGLEDGRILRFTSDHNSEEFVNTGGRPLGMQFDADGNLIVADAVKGLLSINSNAEIKVLTDSVAGVKMLFVDDLDIADDGTIWFSDASQRFGFENTMLDFIEASMTGRLLSYSPQTKQTTVHIDNLFFANGVALGLNEEFVLVNETGTGRIHRYWLKGNKANTQDLFVEALPGNPDNISFNGSDTFWVAMPSKKDPKIDDLASKPWIRTLIAGLPLSAIKTEHDQAFILGLDLNGKVKYNLQSDSHRFRSVTSVNQYGNTLYVGSLKLPAYATYELNVSED